MNKRAGIYARLSHDPDGTSTATARQQEDCRQLAKVRGLEVVEVYEDNDTSAFNKRVRRPAFERMLDDLRRGDIEVVVVWRSDRLARQPRDLERFLDAAEESGGELLSVTEPEFGGSSGKLILRMLVAFANHESGVKAERVARKWREQAERGEPHRGGRRVFGYTHDFQLHETEAPLLREAVARILAGESANAVCKDWRQRGVLTAYGSEWRVSNFIRKLRLPSIAGLRSYHGRLIPGNWEPIIPVEDWQRLQAVLEQRTPKRSFSVRRHLLSGLAVCALCGTPMSGTTRGGKRPGEYRCNRERGGCGRLAIVNTRLEAIVAEQFLSVAGTPQLDAMVAQALEGSAGVSEAMASLREDEAALEQLTKDHYVERTIPRPALLAAKAELEERIAAARRRIARAATPLTKLPTTESALRQEWERRDTAWRRSVLEAVIERIEVLPAGRDKTVDRVRIKWRA